jgi:hypothetical protein
LFLIRSQSADGEFLPPYGNNLAHALPGSYALQLRPIPPSPRDFRRAFTGHNVSAKGNLSARMGRNKDSPRVWRFLNGTLEKPSLGYWRLPQFGRSVRNPFFEEMVVLYSAKAEQSKSRKRYWEELSRLPSTGITTPEQFFPHSLVLHRINTLRIF